MTDDAKNLLRECLQYLYESAPAEVYDRITALLAAPAPEPVAHRDSAEQDRVDAERYRWLRDKWWLDDLAEDTPSPMMLSETPAQFDEAIDRARSAK